MTFLQIILANLMFGNIYIILKYFVVPVFVPLPISNVILLLQHGTSSKFLKINKFVVHPVLFSLENSTTNFHSPKKTKRKIKIGTKLINIRKMGGAS